jgi:hypothetical protein
MKRPISITIIGWFFIVAGSVGFIYHLSELEISSPFRNDAAWILIVRLLAIVGGVLVLRGSNVGRWLLVVWMAYHVVLSYFHTLSELIMHAVLLIVLIIFLFNRRVADFFSNPNRS